MPSSLSLPDDQNSAQYNITFRRSSNTESSNAKKFYDGTLSLGSIQAILKKDPLLIENELSEFQAAVNHFFGGKTLPIEFCYRLRLGVLNSMTIG